MIIFMVAIALILTIFVLSNALVRYAVRPKLVNWQRAHDTEESKGYLGNYDQLKKSDYTVHSYDGYALACMYIPAKESTDTVVLISHGYSYNRLGSVKYMHIFRNLGYDCILFDQRGHGMNKPCNCTFGLREARDLNVLIRDACKRFNKHHIGLHGESMGAATTIMALREKPDIDFAISDCGYGSLPRELTYQMKRMFHLPGFLLKMVDFLGRLTSGFSFYSVIPEKALRNNTIPVCFIHGAADTFVPGSESISMYKIDQGYKELHIVPKADHAQSYQVNPSAYTDIIKAFLSHLKTQKGN